MFVEAFTPISKSKLTVFKIDSGLKATGLGFYAKNHWTDYADKKNGVLPEMLNGLTLDNYGVWLILVYKIFSNMQVTDPMTINAKDLYDLSDGYIKIPWLMTFQEKGFEVDNLTKNKDGLIFKEFKRDGASFEREYIPDINGKSIVLERVYDENGVLDQICSVFRSGENLILKIDDPTMWSYQFSQQRNQFIIQDKTRMYDLARSTRPLAQAALKGGFARSVYTGEIIKGI